MPNCGLRTTDSKGESKRVSKDMDKGRSRIERERKKKDGEREREKERKRDLASSHLQSLTGCDELSPFS